MRDPYNEESAKRFAETLTADPFAPLHERDYYSEQVPVKTRHGLRLAQLGVVLTGKRKGGAPKQAVSSSD